MSHHEEVPAHQLAALVVFAGIVAAVTGPVAWFGWRRIRRRRRSR